MPELGKATYLIEIDSREFNRDLKAIKKNVETSTKGVEKSMGKQSDSVQSVDRDVADLNKTYTKHSGTLTSVGKDTDKFRRQIHLLHDAVGLLGTAFKLLKMPALISLAGVAVRALSTLAGGATALAGALGSATGGLVAMTASLGPLAGALAGVASAYGAMGQAMLAVKLAGVSKVFATLSSNASTAQNAMKALQGPAKAFAETLQGYKDQFQSLRDAAGKGLFGGLATGLKSAMANFGVLKEVIGGTGTVLGNLAKQAGALFGSKAFGKDFQAIGDENNRVLMALGQSALHLVSALRYVLVAARPLVKWMTHYVRVWAEARDRTAEAAAQSGKLNKFFDKTRKILTVLAKAGSHAWSFLKEIGHLAFPTGLKLWGQFADWLAGLDKWAHTEGGRETIKTYFEHAKKALDAVMKVVGPFTDALVHIMSLGRSTGMDILERLGTAAENFDKWVHSAEGENKIASYFKAIRKPLYEAGRLLRDIVDAFFSVGKGQSGTLYDLLHSLRKTVLPAIVELLNQTSKRLGPAVIDIFTEIVTLITNMAGASGPLVIAFQVILHTLRAINFLLKSKVIRTFAVWAFTFYGIFKTAEKLYGVMKGIAALGAIQTATGFAPTIGGKKKAIPMAEKSVTALGGSRGKAAGAALTGASLVPVGGLTGRVAGAVGVGGEGVAATGLAARVAPAASALGIGGLGAEAGAGAGLAAIGATAGIALAAVGALTAAFFALKNNWLGVTDAIMKVMQPLIDSFKQLVDAMSGGNSGAVFHAIGEGFKFIVKWIVPALKFIGKLVIVSAILAVFSLMVPTIAALVVAFKVLAAIIKYTIPFFKILIQGFVWLVKAGIELGKIIGEVVVGAFHAFLTVAKVWVNVWKTIIGILWKFDPIIVAIRVAIGLLIFGFQKVVEFVKQKWGKVGHLLGTPFREGFKLAKAGFNWLKGAVSAAVGWVSDKWGKLKNILTAPFRFAVGIVKSVIGIGGGKGGAAGGGIIGFLGKVIGWVKDKWGALKDALAKPFRTLGGIVSSVFHGILGTIKSILGVAISGINTVIGAFNSVFDRKIDPPGPGPSFGGIHLNEISNPFGPSSGTVSGTGVSNAAEHRGTLARQGRGKSGGQHGGFVTAAGIVGFEKGGMVGSGRVQPPGPKDTVNAALQVGEMVLPKKLVDQLRKRSRLATGQVVGAFGKEYKDVHKDTLKFAADHSKTWVKLQTDTAKQTTKVRKNTIDDFTKTHKSAQKDVDQLHDKATKSFDDLRQNTAKSTGKMKKTTKADTTSMVGAVTGAMQSLSQKLDAALKKLGVDPVNFTASDSGSDKSGKSGKGGSSAVPAKTGAQFAVMGGGSGDTVPLHLGGKHVADVQPKELVTVSHRGAAQNLRKLNEMVKPEGMKGGGSISMAGAGVHRNYPHVSGDTDFVPAMGSALSKMAASKHTNINVNSGWRSYAEQVALYQAYLNGTGNLAARPGTSNHERGTAADISPGSETFGSVAGNFGLAFDVPGESWHVDLTSAGAAGALVGGGKLGSPWKNIATPKLKGPNGALLGMGQATLNKTAAAVNAYGAKHGGSGGYVSGGGGAVRDQIMKILFAQGWDRSGAAGIAGNAYGESGYNPGITGTGGGGLFGFTTPPVSLADVHNYAAKQGKPWDDVGLQMEFMLHGPEPGQPYRGRMNAMSAQDAASYFMTNWERPGIPREDVRRGAAQAAFDASAGATYRHAGIIPGPPHRPHPITAHGQEGVFTRDQMKALGPQGKTKVDVHVHGDIISELDDPVEVVVNDPRFHGAVDHHIDANDDLGKQMSRMHT